MSEALQIPGDLWRTLSRPVHHEPLPKGADAVWNAGLGLLRRLKWSQNSLLARAAKVLELEKEYLSLSDTTLQEKAAAMRGVFRFGRDTEDHLLHACAIIREGARRVFGYAHYQVQIAGALGIEAGCIVEMATGEGKTLTATVPAIINGWRGKGAHVLTANDYLATRDAEEMTPVYEFFGLRVGSVSQDSEPAQRKQAYLADITYLTNKESAADFLRDQIALGNNTGLCLQLIASRKGKSALGELVQRGLECAIVDEADSVLIDEAVTPLIISSDGENSEQKEAFSTAKDIASRFKEGRDYEVRHTRQDVKITREGHKRLESISAKLGGIWKGRRRSAEMIEQALVAKEFYHRNTRYIVDEGKVVIVDESTGRLMPERTWREGLHQAIEAKEGVEITDPKSTSARLSFQRFFRLYRRMGGMTGTGWEARGEFWQIYRLSQTRVPTNRPCLRKMLKTRIYSKKEQKWQAVMDEVREVHGTGRPVLVGTRSIHDSELISKLLEEQGLEHRVLNAVYHREEAAIVSQAGHRGKITVATNMAGRGTDIKLPAEVKEIGGLHVIATERHFTTRIDRQLYGRSSRQGDPGSARLIISLEDELPKRYAALLTKFCNRFRGGSKTDISAWWLNKIFDLAEWSASREARNSRKSVMESDNWVVESLGFTGTTL